jgi:hypothetical protein
MSILNPNRRGRIKLKGNKGSPKERVEKIVAHATDLSKKYLHEERVFRAQAQVMLGQQNKFENAGKWAEAYNDLANTKSGRRATQVRRIDKLRRVEAHFSTHLPLSTSEGKTEFRRFIRSADFVNVFFQLTMRYSESMPYGGRWGPLDIKRDSKNRIPAKFYRMVFSRYEDLFKRQKSEHPNSELTRRAEELIIEMRKRFG